MKNQAPLTGPLLKALRESDVPLLVLANATGIARASLIRFRRGETSLRLDVADKLALYFGIEATNAKPARGRRPTKRID